MTVTERKEIKVNPYNPDKKLVITNKSDWRFEKSFHNDEQFEKIAEKHIRSYTGNESSYCGRIINPGEKSDGWVFKGDQSCYGPLASYIGMYYDRLAVGLYIPKNNEAKMEYKKWILGKFSPWRRAFHEPFKLIESDTHIHGFYLGPETLDAMQSVKHPHSVVLLNFLIATRMVTQFPLHVDLWWEAVKAGNTRADAFFLSRNFRMSGVNQHKTIGDKILKTPIRDSGHYAFGGQIDMKKFLGGHFRTDSKYRGCIWAVEDVDSSGWPFDINKEYWRVQDFDFLGNKIEFTLDEFKSMVLTHPIANQAKDSKKNSHSEKKAA